MQVFATIAALSEEVNRAQLVSPTLILIGRVVCLSPMWPSNSVSIGSTFKQKYSGQESMSASPTILSEKGAKLVEPRNRQQRGPDPSLPSQR